MGGFGGPFSSSSSARHSQPTISGPTTASYGSSAQSLIVGRNSHTALPGGLVAGNNANVGGTNTSFNLRRGAHLDYTVNVQGASDEEVKRLEDLVKAQADKTSAADSFLGNLGQTKPDASPSAASPVAAVSSSVVLLTALAVAGLVLLFLIGRK